MIWFLVLPALIELEQGLQMLAPKSQEPAVARFYISPQALQEQRRHLREIEIPTERERKEPVSAHGITAQQLEKRRQELQRAATHQVDIIAEQRFEMEQKRAKQLQEQRQFEEQIEAFLQKTEVG